MSIYEEKSHSMIAQMMCVEWYHANDVNTWAEESRETTDAAEIDRLFVSEPCSSIERSSPVRLSLSLSLKWIQTSALLFAYWALLALRAPLLSSASDVNGVNPLPEH